MDMLLFSIIVLVLAVSQVYAVYHLNKMDKRVNDVIDNFKNLSVTLQKALKDYDKSLDEKVASKLSDLKTHVDTALNVVSKRIGKREKESEQ